MKIANPLHLSVYMRCCFLFLLINLFCVTLLAQEGDRGASVTNTAFKPPKVELPKAANTYALIIGVSKYDSINSLLYADRDAQSFADFLASKSGGSVPPANIKLFLNGKAKRAEIIMELYHLKEITKPGDKVYLYFAGHGDVERVLTGGVPLLLLSKTPKKNYLIGSEYLELSIFNEVVAGFANDSVDVLFIADACHAGSMLIGGDLGRSRTIEALQKKWGDETKLLSCQPTERSEESVKWGKGRGVFTYVLEKGLKGLANLGGATDTTIILMELSNYLSFEVNHLTEGAQNPMVSGNPTKPLLVIDMPTYLALKQQQKTEFPEMASVLPPRSAEDDLMRDEPYRVKKYYEDFKMAVDKGQLLKPEDGSAYALYLKLDTATTNTELKHTAKRNLVAALQEGTMIFIQSQLNGQKDIDSYNEKIEQRQLKSWQSSIDQLDAAIKILGGGHYLTPYYKARKLYLEAYILYYNMTGHKSQYTWDNYNLCVHKLQTAVNLEPNASYAFYLLGQVYAYAGKNDSARWNYEKYLELNPHDGFAVVNIAGLMRREQKYPAADSLMKAALALGSTSMDLFYQHVGDYYYRKNNDSAICYYNKALKLNPKLYSSWNSLGILAKLMKNNKAAVAAYKKVLALDSTNSWAYNNLAISLSDDTSKRLEAVFLYNKAIKYDSNYHTAYANLASLYDALGKVDTALRLYHIALSMEPYDVLTYRYIAGYHLGHKSYDSAYYYYKHCLRIDTGDAKAMYGLGRVYLKQGNKGMAEYYYRQSMNHDSTYASPCNALGDLFYDNREYEKAVDYYSMAVLNDSSAGNWYDLARAYYETDTTGLAEWVLRNKALKMDSTYAYGYLMLGNLFYDRKQYDSSVWYYKKSLKFNPKLSDAYLNLGLVEQAKHKWDDALLMYQKSLKIDSLNTKAILRLAQLYRKQGDRTNALKFYRQKLEIDTAYDESDLMTMADAFVSMQDSVSAMACIERLFIHKADTAAAFRMASLNFSLHHNEVAASWLQKLPPTDSTYGVAVLYMLGNIEQQRGNNDLALNYYNQVIERRPNDPHYLVIVGDFIANTLKKLQEGRVLIKRAMLRDSLNEEQSYTALAYSYLQEKDMPNSIAWFKKALLLTPADNNSMYNLACIYSLQKNSTEALKYLEASIKAGFDNFKHIGEDTDLDNIRNLPQYAAIMAKYQKEK